MAKEQRHASNLGGRVGLADAATLLEETLSEEKATDEALTRIAESVVNQEAEAV
jgi:ferritin-like metal-binding protein YciE